MEELRKDKIEIRGFGRVQLVDEKTGKIVGDSGWKKNAITQIGFQDYLCALLGSTSGSKQATVLALATQTDAGNSTQTSLLGEFGVRKSANRAVVSSQTLRMTANWATDEATQSTLGAIGAYNTTSGGSVMNALTYATSNKTTDQQLNATLEFRFS
ncbi:MAG: hypothetical protein ACXACX_09235 [Candidatus Hodarchaeales archaeon]|jgi:hypothetical protein